MSNDIIIGYKRLIPTEAGWKSPTYDCEWTDRAQANSIPTEQGSTGIHAVFEPRECRRYVGALVRIQAMGTVVLGDKGFRCEEALILDYDQEEREAFLFFEQAKTITKTELGIRCAMLVYPDKSFNQWADNWIRGSQSSPLFHSANGMRQERSRARPAGGRRGGLKGERKVRRGCPTIYHHTTFLVSSQVVCNVKCDFGNWCLRCLT